MKKETANESTHSAKADVGDQFIDLNTAEGINKVLNDPFLRRQWVNGCGRTTKC